MTRHCKTQAYRHWLFSKGENLILAGWCCSIKQLKCSKARVSHTCSMKVKVVLTFFVKIAGQMSSHSSTAATEGYGKLLRAMVSYWAQCSKHEANRGLLLPTAACELQLCFGVLTWEPPRKSAVSNQIELPRQEESSPHSSELWEMAHLSKQSSPLFLPQLGDLSQTGHWHPEEQCTVSS